jgi:hypothetical protein
VKKTMAEEKKNQELADEGRHECLRKKTLSPEGKMSIQGSDPGEDASSLQWNAKDGTLFHSIANQAVEDSLDKVDKGIEVTSNLPVPAKGENGKYQYGIMDLLIKDNGNYTVIDHKTNDMSNWTISDAIRYGHEQGSQVNHYVHSPELPASTRGVILAEGKSPSSKEIARAYVKAAREHAVDTVFVPGEEPEDVVRAVRASMRKTRNLNMKS